MKHHTKAILSQVFAFVLLLLMLFVIFLPAMAEMTASGTDTESVVMPLTWEYLATIGGAAAFVMLFVQLTKGFIDKFWKIPTTLYAYIIAVITMILAAAFTTGLSPNAILLTLFNGWIVSATASRTYDAMASHKEAE